MSMKRLPVFYYEDYEPLLKHLAKIVKGRSPTLDFDDLMSVGRIAMMEATYSWDPKLGRFATYLYHIAYGYMRNYRRDELRYIHTELFPEDVPGTYNQFEAISLVGKINSCKYLTEEPLQVIKIIFDCPAELLELSENGIKRYLHLKLGWNLFRVKRAVGAIKKFVREEL